MKTNIPHLVQEFEETLNEIPLILQEDFLSEVVDIIDRRSDVDMFTLTKEMGDTLTAASESLESLEDLVSAECENMGEDRSAAKQVEYLLKTKLAAEAKDARIALDKQITKLGI